ncbi:hypothetical protein Acr_11g0009210 [Actinidia rufa]|uniref:Uncharacterized protein n=1 Tax=Actinidia rufa TaxID=165716 RepID=A0A7J0FD69_9ERIC|nr:hypothetical protein Acr_11g0009210 [Actinidia rufa]
MSRRIDLGDGALKTSLPSWLSNHLGGKSYITDDVTQSPSSSLGGSPHGNSSVYIEHPKMDTLNLIKEVKIMTQGDLDKLREKYSFPPERPDKNLLMGLLNNVKSWKKRFFFTSGDEWEFFLSMPSGVAIPSRAKRTEEVLGKIKPGGYCDVSKILASKTFQRYFARGRMEISSSGGENTSLGDDGRLARRDFPDIPDLTLLRWLEGKVQDPFSNLFPCSSSSHLDLKLIFVELGAPPELRSNGRSGQKGQGGHAAATPTQEDQVQQWASNAVGRSLAPRGPYTLSSDNLGPRASMMSSAPMVRKILNGVILPADKEKLAYANSTKLEMVKAQNRSSKVEGQLADLTKELAIDEFKSSNDFKDMVTDSTATYFGEGFEFCKRQLLHHHPNLSVDLVSMVMDTELAEEEKANKVSEKEEEN